VPLKEILHPGFPRIGAIDIFRQNTIEQLQEGTVRLKEEIRNIRTRDEITHKDRGGFKIRKQSDSPVQFHTYFDKNEYSSKINEINEMVKAKALEMMIDAMEEAKWETAREINDMPRAFKSNMRPNTAAAGDLYDTIGNSLDYDEKINQDNQFASFTAGSREDGEGGWGKLTGVRGSRMNASNANLVELTEEGTDGFGIYKIGAYFAGIRENPAKRMKGG
jgi:hypothetical protein